MFLNFYILNTDDEHGAHNIDYPMLLNAQHITSIKPINILVKGSVIAGFWIRMSNGKKYKATRIPKELLAQVSDEASVSSIAFGSDLGNESPEIQVQ